jgi:predicted O-methyltransferase YrrM
MRFCNIRSKLRKGLITIGLEKNRLIKKSFEFWQRLGIHITSDNFYEPIPNTAQLSDDVWERETEMKGIDLNVEEQIEFLDTVCSRYKKEYDSFDLYKSEEINQSSPRYYVYNGMFGEIDGDILFCMIRHYKPKRIIEIGSGWSTYLSAYTIKQNQREFGVSCELTAIEPFPNKILKNGFLGLSVLIEKKVQDVDLKIFEALEENDILFIDSSHVVKINSDVCYEYLEILPRLKKGVLVHIHDVFLPKDYPRNWVVNLKIFWNEAYLFQAFLIFNRAFKVIWAGNYMKLKYPEKFRKMFRSQASQSFWIRKEE